MLTRRLQSAFQLVFQDAVFSGQIFVLGQQLLIHCHVGQDARPIHNGPFALIPCAGDRPKNVPERLRQRYAGRGQLTVLSAV